MKTFASFYVLDEAIALQEFFSKKGIESVLDSTKLNFDATFANTESHSYLVRLESRFFSKAHLILDEFCKSTLTPQIVKGHFFQEYKSDELTEVVESPAEWSPFEYHVAVDILRQRGVEYSDSDLENFKSKSIEKQFKVTSIPSFARLLWSAAVLILPMFAIGAGFFFQLIKRPDENGENQFIYDKSSREFASVILWSSLAVLIAMLYLGFSGTFNGLLSDLYEPDAFLNHSCVNPGITPATYTF